MKYAFVQRNFSGYNLWIFYILDVNLASDFQIKCCEDQNIANTAEYFQIIRDGKSYSLPIAFIVNM